MPIECPKLKRLVLSGSKLSKLNLGLTPQLWWLDLEKCYHLQELHAPVGCLADLANFKLSGCLRFEYFVVSNEYVFPPIETLATVEVELIAESLDECPLHLNNNMPKFKFKCFYEEPLPSSSGNLEKLLSFGLCACTNLESFSASICGLRRLRKLTLKGSLPEVPKDLYHLQSLEELTLSMNEIKHLPHSICMLKYLKHLQLISCWLLERLPENLGQLEHLEKLIISDCISLLDIPNSICNMKCLKCLYIEGTGIMCLPESIFELKPLVIMGSRWQLESFGFTSLSVGIDLIKKF